MSKIIAVHSFRQGVGKSSVAASLAVLLAERGKRVALLDMDFPSAGLNLFFGVSDVQVTINDYLWGDKAILNAVYDVSGKFLRNESGKLYLLPASAEAVAIVKTLRVMMNLEHYSDGLKQLIEHFRLDAVILDTSAGLNENTLLALAPAHDVIIVLRQDNQDFQGTAVSLDVARNLQTPSLHVVLNDASESLDEEDARKQLAGTYHSDDNIVLKHADELMATGSAHPFVCNYPDHPWTVALKELAGRLV